MNNDQQSDDSVSSVRRNDAGEITEIVALMTIKGVDQHPILMHPQGPATDATEVLDVIEGLLQHYYGAGIAAAVININHMTEQGNIDSREIVVE